MHTRFPPEPNGYLHIGHAKSVCLNFKIAADYHGLCNLRMDDTNPVKEEVEYIESIIRDVRWLGFDWDDRLFYASDYYERLYNMPWAHQARQGLCGATRARKEMRRVRARSPSPERKPYRNHTIEENLDLFERMKAGEFREGKDARARSTWRLPIEHARPGHFLILLHYHRTEANGIHPCVFCPLPLQFHRRTPTPSARSVRITGRCTTGTDQLDAYHPQQIGSPGSTHLYGHERNSSSSSCSEVRERLGRPQDAHDLRHEERGTPEAIRNCERIGVAKNDSMVDVELLEFCVREDLTSRP